MKVLIADKFEDAGRAGLEKLGCEVQYSPALEGDALRRALVESESSILVVRSTRVDRSAIEASRLSLIIRAGAGVNTIDVEAASERGIFVSNCPGKNSQAVAELAFGLMLAIDRRIPDNVRDLREGRWRKAEYSQARGLHGRTLGLLGMGAIGQEMVPRAKAFGMNVIAASRWMTPEIATALGIMRAESVWEVAKFADVISIHVSLRPETRGLVNAEFLAAMKPGSILINTSRAELIDQEALLDALNRGHIFAGLDVFEGEPEGREGTYEGPLRDAPNVYGTHHIGASTLQAQDAVAQEVVRIVRSFLESGGVPNLVNVAKGSGTTHILVVRHLDKVGVLADVLSMLKHENCNVQEMENVILGNAQAAIAQIGLDKAPSAEAIFQIKSHADVFDASVMQAPQTP